MNITLTFTVPDAIAQTVIDDLALARGYEEQVLRDRATSSDMIPNPEDKLTFLKESITKELMEQVGQYQETLAAQLAGATAQTQSAQAAQAVSVTVTTGT